MTIGQSVQRQFQRVRARLAAMRVTSISLLLATLLAPVGAPRLQPTSVLTNLPPGFFEAAPITGLHNPIGFAWTPDGRLFVGERTGALRVVKNGQALPAPALTLSVNTVDESGLLGIAIDPQFAAHPYIYLYYTAGPSSLNYPGLPVNRVSRFTVSGDTAALNSELILVDNIPAGPGEHEAGDLHFAANGFLFVSTGDALTLSLPQDLDSLGGKILRIDPATGLGAPDNPFNTNGASLNRQRVWAYGLRNPYRIGISPNTGTIYIADVGDTHFEELDLGQPGANYGWPQVEGPNPPGVAGVTYPIYWYAHSGNADPNLAGCTAMLGGPFVPATNMNFPADYADNYFISDYVCNRIFRVQPGSPPTVTLFAGNAGQPVNMGFGPDGMLYYSDLGANLVRRIRYTASNRPPTAQSSADQTTGALPLTVHFGGDTSFDPDGDPITYNWDFGDGATSTAANPQHTYTTAGNYPVVLTVTDNSAASGVALPIPIYAGDLAPQVSILSPANGTQFRAGAPITLQGTATDADGPAPSLTWEVRRWHGVSHYHPWALGSGPTLTTTMPPPEDLLTAGTSYMEVRLTAIDSAGASVTAVSYLYPQTAHLTFQTQPPGLSLVLDGDTYLTPVTLTSAQGWSFNVGGATQIGPGGQSYDLTSWSDGGAPGHALLTPDTDTTFTATFTVSGSGATPTPTNTPAATATKTNTPTPTNTSTPTNTATATQTPTITSTPTATPLSQATSTPSNTPQPSPTATKTPTGAPTATNTATNTPTATATNTATPSSGTLFADGFETGNYSQWTATVLGPAAGSVNAVAPAAAFAGAFGAHLNNGVGGKLSNGSSISKSFTAPTNQVVSAQARLKVNSLAGTGALRLFQLRDSVSGQAVVRVRLVNGVAQLLLVRRNLSQVTANFTTNLSLGAWHLLELTYDWSGPQPVGQVWVDGVLQARIVDTTTGGVIAPNTVFGMVYEDTITATADVYFDDVQVANGYIGLGASPTATPSPTSTSTSTNTPAPTNTPTNTPTSTPSSTSTPSDTPLPTNTSTSTPAPTNTPSATPTATSTSAPSATPTPTSTPTNTSAPTNTPSATPTATSTSTPSNTPLPTNTPTNTPAPTNTPSSTPTATAVPVATATPTDTPTSTPTATSVPTATNTPTPTATATPTSTPTATSTPTSTPSPTPTALPTATSTPTDTPTATSTPTDTAQPAATATSTDTPTATNTSTPTATATNTATPSSGTLFADGFETGNYSQWTATVLGPAAGSVNAVAPAAAFAGAFGAHLNNGVGGKESNGPSISKSFTAPANHVVSAQMRLKVNSLAGTGALRLFQLRDSVSNQAVVRVRLVNGVAQLLLVRRNLSQVTANFTTNLSLGAWHLVELSYDWSGPQPVGQVWVDGVLQARIVDTSPGGVITPNTVFGMVYEDTITATADLYLDDVLVTNMITGSGATPTAVPTPTNTLVGAATATPTSTPTPSSTPTATRTPTVRPTE